jgi:hypothetical protein
MLEGRTVHETVSKGEGEENENLLEEFWMWRILIWGRMRHFIWCVLKRTPQTKNRCNVQNTQVGTLGLCRERRFLIHMCKLQNHCFWKMGVIVTNYCKWCWNLPQLWGIFYHMHSFWETVIVIYNISMLPFIWNLSSLNHNPCTLVSFVVPILNKPEF